MKQLKLILTTSMFLLAGCTAGFESKHEGEFDSATVPNTILFTSAQQVIAQNCTSCHNGGRATSFEFTTAQEFVTAGLIIPGNPRQSPLIRRMQNYDGPGASNNNMPLNRQALSQSDFQTIYNWIVEMPSGQSPFQCNDTELRVADMEESHAKRLSARQYENTLRDLLVVGLNNTGTANQIVTRALNDNPLPGDAGENFSREANSFTGAHALAYYEIANSVAQEITDSHAYSFVGGIIAFNNPGNCPTSNISSLSTACRDQFLRNLILLAFRRPARTPDQNLTTVDGTVIDELESYRAEFQGVTGAEGVNRVLFRLLFAPHFLFQLEDQNLISIYLQNEDVYRLSSYAIINRLSYQFWNTLPDATLFQMARDNDLNEPDAYSQAVEHILSRQDKLDDSLREYFNEWLHLEDQRPFARQERLALIDNSITFDSGLRQNMIQEVEELGSWVTRSGGSFQDLFMTDVSFARDPDLMRIYGLTQAAPTNITESNAVRFPASQRAGILTRATMLTSGSENMNPIRRAVNIAEKILCRSFGTPPANATEVFESTPIPPNATSRERVEQGTSNATCLACHERINPLGFAFSNYNAFGGYITEEPIFSQDGSFIQAHVGVDAAVDLSELFGPGTTAVGGVELSQIVGSRESTRACFAEKYLTYSHGRPADREKDACRLDRIYNNLSDDGQLVDMIRASALDAAFRLRKMTPVQ